MVATIYDIARQCGVTGATVSKALNGHKDISEKKREMILKAAEEMGYMPNAHARTLTTKRSYDIGILFIDESQNGLTHQFFSNILENARLVLEENGYDISFISCRTNGIQGGYLQHCKYRGVDGVILACIDFDNEDVQKLIYSDIPVVLIDKELSDRTCIVSGNYEGTKNAVKYLVDRGHKKIGFIHGQPTSTLVTEKRLEGFYDGMKDAGLEVNQEWMRQGSYYEFDKTYQMTKEVLSLQDRPSALLLPDDYAALAAYRAIRELNLNIPEDISLIGNDGLKLVDILIPNLTTVYQDQEQIGRLAAQQIIRLVENNNIKPKTYFVPTRIREGESVRKI